MPPELIFILVLIVFSVLENALKGKKKKGGPIEGPPRTGLPPGWPPPGADRPEGRGQREGEPRTSGESRTIPAQRDRASDMVPEELWEEIAALARGDVDETLRRRRARARAEAERARRQGTAPGPHRQSAPPGQPRPGATAGPPVPSRSAPGPSGDARPSPGDEAPAVLTPAGRTRTPRSREPRSREGYHTERLKEARQASGGEDEQTGLAAIAAGPPAPATGPSTRESFTQGRTAAGRRTVPLREAARARSKPSSPKVRGRFRGPGALRNAIIAREVLGRPLALREYGEEEMWSE